MPTLEALDAFKKNINDLGDEPRLLAERGESPSDVAPPAAPVDSDLERLLDENGSGDGVDEMEALLGAYSEDLEGPAEPDTPAEGIGDFSLDDFEGLDEIASEDFADREGADLPDVDSAAEEPSFDDFTEPDEIAADGPAYPDEPEPAPTARPAEADFSLDDLDLDGMLGGEPDSGFGPEEEAETVEASHEGAQADDFSFEDEEEELIPGLEELAGGPEDEGFSDLVGIEEGIGDEESSGAEETWDDAELSADDFSLDDLDFGEAETGADEPVVLADIEGSGFDADLEAAVGEDLPEFGDESGISGDIGDEETASEEVAPDDFDLEGIDEDLPPGGESEGPEDFGEIEDLGDFDELGTLDEITDLGEETLPSAEEDTFPEPLPEDEAGTEDLENLADFGDEDDAAMPDVGTALEGLGDLDSLEEGPQDELSLDDELNFDEELGADTFADITDIDEDSQQFSMEDFGDQYNFKEGEDGYADNLGVDLEKLEQSLDEAAEEEGTPFGIEEEDLEALLLTLSSLPRNLKIALEELLADERRSPQDLQPLIDALVDGESPKALAARFKTITKRSIALPRTYEKRSGRALEARRAALTYRLAREGWPVVRVMLAVIAVIWTLGAALFMWVYRPLKAESLYEKGLNAVAVDDVEEAGSLFHDAWDGWPLFAGGGEGGDRIADAPVVVKGWKDNGRWLDYARALRRRKHWNAAADFYEGYLAVKPGSKDARLEYAAFLSRIMGRYADAVEVLENAPQAGGRNTDREFTLAAGDVYLDWAEDDPSKYEEARFRYAKVLETSRNDERAILSMMRYHLKLNDDEEINTLLPVFDSEVPGRTNEPELAAEVYADLGMNRLARGDAEQSRRFIDLALAAYAEAPEPHYADARYWEARGDEMRELEADKRTLIRLDGRESLSRDDLEMRILTLGSMGRIHSALALRANGDPSRTAELRSIATGSYSKALKLYEDALSRNQLGASPEYGKLYLELGDILFEGAAGAEDLAFSLAPMEELVRPGGDRYEELAQAVGYYDEAEAVFGGGTGGGLPAETLYRRAYARYSMDSDGAIVDFHRVVRRRPQDYEARIALASALLRSGDYEASRSQYARAIELLDEELRRTGGVLSPAEKQGHGELLIRYVVAWNNLGVGRARVAARGGGEDDYAAALSAFTMASEYSDEVYDDMTSLAARGMTPLRDLEDRRMMASPGGDDRNLLEEKSTYPYRNRLRLLGLETAEADEEAFLAYTDIPSDLQGGR